MVFRRGANGCLAVCCCLVLGLSTWCRADDSDEVARSILAKAGIRVGVCEMPRVGDGTLAAALARQGIAQVHGLAGDAKSAEAARKAAAECGVLGCQVVVETGTPSAIPLGDWVADLLVVADATDANLNEIPPAEVRRVVAPYRGVVVIGNPGPRKNGLGKKALTAWAGETGAEVQVEEDGTGLWAVIRMPPLEGGDDWGHHAHAADGNLLSEDKVFGSAPFELQWTGGPYYGGHWDMHVVCAGRMFTAQSSVFQHPRGLPYELVTRSAYNGQVLWRRPIAQDFGESASLVVATPERLFLKDGGGVLVLDPETGTEIRRIATTSDATQECLWLLVSDGVLLTLMGPVQKYSAEADDYSNNPPKRRAQDEVNELYVGRELTAWDAATGAQLWRFTEEQIDPPKLAAAHGRAYLYAKRLYAACLDLKSGKEIWKTAAPIAEPKGPGMGWIDGHATVKNMSIHRQGSVVTKDVYMISYLPHRQCQAFSATDGRLLWDRMHGPAGGDAKEANLAPGRMMFGYNVVMDRTIVERRAWQKPSDVFDLLTGEAVPPGTRFSYGGCGRFTGLASGLLFGQMGEIYDVKANKRVLNYNAKSSCGTGQFVADGLLFKVGANCSACSEWRGFFASRSVPKREMRRGARLEKGVAGEPKETAGDASDWVTYRSDATRKGSSAAAVPAGASVRWTFAPVRAETSVYGEGGGYLGPDRNPTPPICGGERVLCGTAEGAVVCLDRKTGTEAWRYWTAGRMMGPPTWWQGRVYAGSCDGWVYCLDAATGALAWRYRVAPEDRRIMVLGRLSSAWPILANVLVQDGTVFAAGGLVAQLGGSVLCALDARTGEPRWEKRFNGATSASAPAKPRFTREGEGRNFRLDAKIDASATGCAPEVVYHSLRMGTGPAATYTFHDLKPDSAYTVRLHFVEPWEKAAGKRVMDVTVNGQPGLTKFDIFAEAGGRNKAIVRAVRATADAEGNLSVRLARSAGTGNAPLVSGTEVLAGDAAVCGGQAGGRGVARAGFSQDRDAELQPAPLTPSASGQLAWYGGRLWWHVGDSGILVADPATGDVRPAVDSETFREKEAGTWYVSRGQDIGILPGGWVVFGGRQFNLPLGDGAQPRNSSSFLRADPEGAPVDGKGYPKVLVLRENHAVDAIPVWDAAETLLFGKPAGWQIDPVPPLLCRDLGEALTEKASVRPEGEWNSGARLAATLAPAPDQQRPIYPEGMKFRSLPTAVLAANAMVFLTGDGNRWRVVAVNRADRELLWDVELPGRPLLNGLALTRAGSVLAPLIDGRVVCVGTEGQP